MSPKEEKKSRRQERREQMRRRERGGRLIWIGVVILVAVAIAGLVIYQQVKPIDPVQPVQSAPRPQANRNSMGDPNAPIKIDEYSDFQCPYCKRFFESTEPLLVQYYIGTGKVYFTYHSAGNWVSRNIGRGKTESQDAAMAAYCAADQNKFWQMHDALFGNNNDREDEGSFVPRRLVAIAQSVGLDMNQFNDCFNSNKYKGQTEQDFNDATTAGINGTPFFVVTYTVNGETKTKTIDGAQPFDTFQQELEAALNEMGAK